MRFVVLLLLSAASTYAANCPSDSTYNSVMNRCYKYVTQLLPYQEAQQSCWDTQGKLVDVHNATENLLIAEQAADAFRTQNTFWLGLDNLNGPWTWSDGRVVTYNSWAPGEPGNQTFVCGYSNTSSGSWKHSSCGVKKYFVCAYPAYPITTTRGPTTTPGPKCPKEQVYFATTDSCYWVGSGADFWAAESQCNQMGGHLTSIHNAYENTFVVGLTSTGASGYGTHDQTWIGMHIGDKNTWLWTDGSDTRYTNWMKGQPAKNPCAEVVSDDYNKDPGTKFYWHAQLCTDDMRKFVCKMKPLW